MTVETQEKEEKYISEQLRDILAQLSTDQIRFVVARQECATDKEAAEAVGISPQTVYRWPDAVKEAVRLMAADGLVVAQEVRRRHLAKAMLVKTAGLDSKNERIRQGVSTELIEWEMGKATQRSEITGRDGGPIETKTDGQQFDRTISAFADAVGEILSRPGTQSDGSVDAAEQAAMVGPPEPGR